jgi:transposase
MKKSKPTFSLEFKREAAELITLKRYSYAKACEARGVSESALRRWVSQLRGALAGKTPVGAKAMTDDQQEVQRLRAQVLDLQEDNEILKKATALFASLSKTGNKPSRC